MLVLSRKIGEEVVLPGCGVTIAIIRIAGNNVRLGIDAPTQTAVHRREVFDRISAHHTICAAKKPIQNSNRHRHANQSATPAAATQTDPCELLARRIIERTAGGILSLRVE